MSRALAGEHLCPSHQGNYSHYAPDNCAICRLTKALEDVAVSRNAQWSRHVALEALAALKAMRGAP